MIEEIGRELDGLTKQVFDLTEATNQVALRNNLVHVGQQGERLNRIRLGLLSIERALGLFRQIQGQEGEGRELRDIATEQLRDVEALGQHADFLSGGSGSLPTPCWG